MSYKTVPKQAFGGWWNDDPETTDTMAPTVSANAGAGGATGTGLPSFWGYFSNAPSSGSSMLPLLAVGGIAAYFVFFRKK